MTADHEDEIGMDHLDMQLLALGEAALPRGFDSRLKNFSEMMAAVEDLPVSDDELDDVCARDAEVGEIARDAFELGLGYLDRGDLDRAERWLARAARYGLSQAEDKLADLAELRTALAEIDLDFLPVSRHLSALERALTETLSGEAPSVAQAHESAQAIIDGAHRQAESIIALAELRARRSATTRANLTGESARFTRVLWESHDDLRANIHVTPAWMEQLVSLADVGRSNSPRLLVAGQPGVGKTTLYSELLRDAASSGQRVLLIVDSCAASSDWVARWSRLWREWVVSAARPGTCPREGRSQDELLQLYEFAGGEVDGLRRTAGWRLWNHARAHGGREASGEVIVQCKTFTRTLMQYFDCYGLGKIAFDLMSADGGGLMVPDAWLEQSDGLVVPPDLRAEPLAASAWRG